MRLRVLEQDLLPPSRIELDPRVEVVAQARVTSDSCCLLEQHPYFVARWLQDWQTLLPARATLLPARATPPSCCRVSPASRVLGLHLVHPDLQSVNRIENILFKTINLTPIFLVFESNCASYPIRDYCLICWQHCCEYLPFESDPLSFKVLDPLTSESILSIGHHSVKYLMSLFLRCYKRETHLELEGDRVCAKVGIELCVDVHTRRFPGGVLHDQEQLRHDLDHVAGLEDKVPLPLHRFGGKAPWDVGL